MAFIISEAKCSCSIKISGPTESRTQVSRITIQCDDQLHYEILFSRTPCFDLIFLFAIITSINFAYDAILCHADWCNVFQGAGGEYMADIIFIDIAEISHFGESTRPTKLSLAGQMQWHHTFVSHQLFDMHHSNGWIATHCWMQGPNQWPAENAALESYQIILPLSSCRFLPLKIIVLVALCLLCSYLLLWPKQMSFNNIVSSSLSYNLANPGDPTRLKSLSGDGT